MEFSMSCSVLEFLENKSILVTGATGFLAKVFIEKILRVQPKIQKLYLLLRAADSTSAMHRFDTEVIGKELFVVVKEKYGANLDSLIQEKVRVIAGDVTRENLGVQDMCLVMELLTQVEVVVNLAATTDFDERYDVAFGINTMGPLQVLNFAKRCKKLRVLLQVSTAYVCGEAEGVVKEKPYTLGESLNGTAGLDINVERKIIEETLDDLKSQKGVTQNYISFVMKDLGITRARKYGWPNAYAFTKAMGEMLVGHMKGDSVPLVIIRPTIVTSTHKEPFPGWLEGIRNIDSFIVGYGKGKMNCFVGDPNSIVDLIPVDMVVNAIIIAMVAHVDKPGHTIYHVCSSKSNPVLYSSLQAYGLRYFTERPWINSQGEPVIVKKGIPLGTIPILHRYMQIHFLIPLKMLHVVNEVTCKYFEETYVNMSRKVKFLMRLIELFTPYVYFQGKFDDTQTERLRSAAREGGLGTEMFNFDPKTINWDDYFMYTHIAGVVKYGFIRR